MRRWAILLTMFLLSAACAPAVTPTPTPIPKVPASTPVPVTPTTSSQSVGSTPKPAVTTPAATAPTAAPKTAVQPLNPPVTVKIGGTGSLTEGFLYIADAKGYFTDEGLKAQFVRFQSATQMVAPMGTGDLDAGGGSPGPGLYNAIARNIPIKIVASRSQSRPGQANLAIMVRKDLIDSGAIKDYSDFKGKNIAINATGSSTDIALEKALQKGNIKRADVNVVTMPFPDMVTAFASKAIDVGIDVDPYNALSVDKGVAVRWKGEDDVYPNHETSVLLLSPVIAQNNPEAAKRLVLAYVRGIRDYLNAFTKNINKADVISILTKYTDVSDPTLYDKMAVIGVDPNGYVNADSLAADQDWYFSQGLQQQKVDMSKVIDNQYVDYAVQVLGKY